jgi:ribonuclease-3
MADKLQSLERVLGYQFNDPELLRQAVTHRSRGAHNNERLEFLGDSVLNFVIAEALFAKFPEATEGELSRMRASLVRGRTLAKVAREELELGNYLQLGPGEMKSGGHRRSSILADTLEAILGAVLLDADFAACRARVLHLFSSRLDTVLPELAAKDAKTVLQEYLQGRGQGTPIYHLLGSEGEDHAQVFTVACEITAGGQRFEGEGSSRRKAEQVAAALALESLNGSS